MPRFANRARLSPIQAEEVARELGAVSDLDALEGWRQTHQRPLLEHLVHGRDAHDLVLPWSYNKTLVVACDCQARVLEVAIWDVRPTGEDLLEARRLEGGLDEAHEMCPLLARLGPA